MTAKAIEARSGETRQRLDPKDESAVRSIRQNPIKDTPMTPKDTTPDPVHPAPAPSLVEAEPVAWKYTKGDADMGIFYHRRYYYVEQGWTETPLYAHPAALSVTDPAIERMREALEFIAEEHDAGRHDGLPEPCPAHEAEAMWAIARAALQEQQP